MVKKALTGAESAAEAMKQINPDVVPAYPITPQTEIMHQFTKFVADKKVDTEMILVESEHSAMSAAIGASAAGARVMTATASNGLAYMHEVVYIAASSRLPIIMTVVNRALSGPINIHCDHSDTMAERDSGWIQIYCENNQEAYDTVFLALKLAEHEKIRLPAMVCMDGFITSHSVEGIELIPDEPIKKFIGEHVPIYPLLDTTKPITFGPLDFYDYYFEHKRQQSEAINNVRLVFPKIAEELSKITGRNYDFIEKYKSEDADYLIIIMSSSAGTTKDVVDELRKEGKKVGLIKIRMYRPFPFYEVGEAIKNAKAVAILDRAESFGAVGGPLFNEVRSTITDFKIKPKTVNYVFGLGGREYTKDHAKKVYADLEQIRTKDVTDLVTYLGVRD